MPRCPASSGSCMETNEAINGHSAPVSVMGIVSEPVRVDIPTAVPPPPNRSRSKTIYLDTILTSDLRDELTQDRDELLPSTAPEECTAGFFRINAKPQLDNPRPWANPGTTPARLLPLLPLGFVPHEPQPTAAASTERRQLALTSILTPESVSETTTVAEKVVRAYVASTFSPAPTTGARIIGFLVPVEGDAKGEIFVLRLGRTAVTSEDGAEGSSAFRVNDRTVSAGHATIKVDEDGAVQVLDQYSEHGTTVRRLATGEELRLHASSAQLEHGDEVCFGTKVFNVCLLAARR